MSNFIFQSLELLKSFSIKILKLKKNTSLYGVEIENKSMISKMNSNASELKFMLKKERRNNSSCLNKF